MNKILAEFVTTNAYDLGGSGAITRNADGIPIASEEHPPAVLDTTPLNAKELTVIPKAKNFTDLKSLTVAGIEQHICLLDAVKGTEEITLESIKSNISSLYDHAKFAVGTTYKYAQEGYTKITRVMITSIGTRKQAFYVLKRDLGDKGLITSPVLTNAQLSALTSTGKFHDLIPDANILLKALESLRKHANDVDGYLEHLLSLLKSVKNVKTNKDAQDILSKLNEVPKPTWRLPHHTSNTMSVSEVLPGGKVFKFEENSNKVVYSMTGDKPSGDSDNNGITKDELSSLMSEAGKINDFLNTLAGLLTNYVTFIKRWGEAVKDAETTLDKADVASATKQQLEKLMDGPVEYLVFYSGFLPKVVSYTDRYVQDIVGLSGKLIN